jgi:hypothetical protein
VAGRRSIEGVRESGSGSKKGRGERTGEDSNTRPEHGHFVFLVFGDQQAAAALHGVQRDRGVWDSSSLHRALDIILSEERSARKVHGRQGGGLVVLYTALQITMKERHCPRKKSAILR